MTDKQKLYNQAVELRTEGNLEGAGDIAVGLWESGYQEPNSALLLGNLALDFGKFSRALDFHTVAMSLQSNAMRLFGGKPSNQEALKPIQLALAESRLRLEMWDAFTWSLWENARYGSSWSPPAGMMPWFGQPDKILVMFEGGYGDAFLFTRFFQKLEPEQRAASRFALNPRFPGLNGFRDLWDGIPVLGFNEPVTGFTHATGLMSLMAAQAVSGPWDVPSPQALLPSESLNVIDGIVSGGDKPRIGLCWSAEENGQERRTRSIDNPEDLEPLAKWKFLNLTLNRSLPVSDRFPLLSRTAPRTWSDTARVIAGVDAVVTVDTAVCHLAGLLGVPTFLILPVSSDWKWGDGGETSFWWPSVRIFRNKNPYSFREVVAEVAAALDKL